MSSEVKTLPSPLAALASVFHKISNFSLALTLFCMMVEALSSSLLTSKNTLDPYLVKNNASSQAESPPPITANGLFLNMGIAPSHTAQAEIPCCQYLSSPGKCILLAEAPVAIMTASEVMGSSSSLNSVQSLNGLELKSTLEMVSVMMLVPNLNDCSLMLSINAEPLIPWGKPGKFSMSVVVVNWPPAAKPLAKRPSYKVGLTSALAKYMAAV